MGAPLDASPVTPARRRARVFCHDFLCLILFAAMWAGMIAIGIFANRYGNRDRLLHGYDSEGNLCGSGVGVDSTRDLAAQPYLYYFGVELDGYRKCVAQCPTVTLDMDTVECVYDTAVGASRADKLGQVNSHACVYTYASQPIYHRCVPSLEAFNGDVSANMGADNTTSLLAQVLSGELNGRATAAAVFQDLFASLWIIVACSGIALALGMIVLLLVQWFGAITIWTGMIAGLVTLWGLGGFLAYNYYLVYEMGQAMIQTGFEPINTLVYNKNLLLACAIFLTASAAILTLVTLLVRKHINLAMTLMGVAARALRAVPFIVFFPLLKYLALMALVVWCVWVFALLSSSGTVIAAELSATISAQTETIPGHAFQVNAGYGWFQLYYVFGFLWTYNWIIAISQTTMAGVMSSWYFARDKSLYQTRLPVMRSLATVLWYHLGSLAFGSLIIALFELMLYLLGVLQHKLEKSQLWIASVVVRCIKCCCGLLTSIVKLFSKNAYIEIAIYGYGFVKAARVASSLIVRNMIHLSVLTTVSGFVIFLCKLMIACGTTVAGLGLLMHYNGQQPWSNYAVPLVVIFIVSYVIASAFLAIYAITLSTVFLCFCEDCERNDGSPARPYFMPEALLRYVPAKKQEMPLPMIATSARISPIDAPVY
ncbi:hypothetical protein CXG81DRAFT_12276 [Caulochytrium protostelioides]|uniref:Protein PNS1 n=1 Tax=Caulochytrium protostelioides TaxID=1555241 RepID=A0A4P9X7K1_9FUNG|nr:hypothetical protein CXG81DRAFT_12276 [Caulochytrium protostelioides]|eukprot:RKP01224.1 hypothetical protein CXG81DRAFT_12276 [Caulochytrium protostelioides]